MKKNFILNIARLISIPWFILPFRFRKILFTIFFIIESRGDDPRKGLKSGSIKNSFCLPFSELINEDHTFVSKDKIQEKFESFEFDHKKNIVF